jgi:aquaporin Z
MLLWPTCGGNHFEVFGGLNLKFSAGSVSAVLNEYFQNVVLTAMPIARTHIRITALPSDASIGFALRQHWHEYLMECAQIGAFMVSICCAGTFLYSPSSPLVRWWHWKSHRALLMGLAVALTTLVITRSPFGRRTGAHFNPALTLTYFYLGRVHRWDALLYALSQFLGGVCGIFVAEKLLGMNLSGFPVLYLVTVPGRYGVWTACLAEVTVAFLLMLMILVSSNHQTLMRYTPELSAVVTVASCACSTAASGYSTNPARSFASAVFAQLWYGIWIYFVAPCVGMLLAAALYRRTVGASRIYCAKVFHDLSSPCPFFCQIHDLVK